MITLQHKQQYDVTTIESGLDFILSHFLLEDPFLFPRKISTYKSQINKPYQFSVSSKEEIIKAFRESNFIDCRLNAYPCLTEYKGIQRYKPDLLFIDLDKKSNNNNNNSFKTDRSLELVLSKTLNNINEVLGGYPTVLFTGGGYHIIQPVYCPTALEYVTEFSNYDRPSERFLRFAKDYFSNGEADPSNHPSFKSCLLRIPGSINSKYGNKVTIVQKWNGIRSPITKDILLEFRRYLIQKKIEAAARIRRINNNFCDNTNCYDWIETKVLQTPLSDYRKLVIGLVLVPYLIVIRKLSYEESYKIIFEWLMKCNSLSGRKLDFDPKYLVNNSLKTSMKKLIPPISIYKLEMNYPNLYLLLLDQNNNNNSSNLRISNQTNSSKERREKEV